MNFINLIMEDALINERTNQRRLYSAAVAIGDHLQAKIHKSRIEEIQKQLNKEGITMTREEELKSMRMQDLEEIAKGLEIKINKKGSKAKAIEKILEAEAEAEELTEQEIEYIEEDIEATKTAAESILAASEDLSEDTKEKAKAEPKRANKKLTELTYNGETKSIREWADELGMPWPTLYDRVNRNGWSVEDAIEIPLGQRRPK